MKYKQKIRKLEARIKQWEEIPVADRKGFHRPESLSK